MLGDQRSVVARFSRQVATNRTRINAIVPKNWARPHDLDGLSRSYEEIFILCRPKTLIKEANFVKHRTPDRPAAWWYETMQVEIRRKLVKAFTNLDFERNVLKIDFAEIC